MSMTPDLGAKVGLDFETIDVQVYLRGPTSVATSTVTAGDLLAFCMADNVEITNSSTYDTVCSSFATYPGPRNSIFANVTKNYTSANVGSQIFGIALQNAVVGSATNVRPLITVRVRGIVKAAVQSADNTTSVTIGRELMMANPSIAGNKAGFLDASASPSPTSTATRRKIGIALEVYNGTSAGTSAGTLMQVLFDGLNGFGSSNNA